MIEHLVFNCQSSRVGAGDASRFALGARTEELRGGRSARLLPSNLKLARFPLARCYPRSFTFYVAIPIRSILLSDSSSDVESAIESFIRYLAVERGLSDNYQLSTQRSLTDFANWCAHARKIDNVRAVTLPMLSDYLAAKKKAGLSAASIKLIVVAVKIFFRFLAGKGAIERDPTEAVPLPRIERYLPETLNEMQVEKLLNSVDTKAPRGLRDRAMLELLYASGLRISELANARLENFYPEERTIRVIGKGNKTRIVPVGRKACEALAVYLSTERPRLVKRRTGNEIFLSERGTKLTTARIWQIVKEKARHAGLEKNIYPHLLRHSFATHLLSNSADLRIIRKCSDTPTFLRHRFTHTSISRG